jgi:hypothetical protein
MLSFFVLLEVKQRVDGCGFRVHRFFDKKPDFQWF